MVAEVEQAVVEDACGGGVDDEGGKHQEGRGFCRRLAKSVEHVKSLMISSKNTLFASI